MIHKRSTAWERSVKTMEDLNLFNGTILILSFHGDQDAYGKMTQTQEYTTHKGSTRSALSQQVTRMHETDNTA